MAEYTPDDVSEAVPFTGPIYASAEELIEAQELAAAVAVDNARHARRTRILVALGFVAFLGGAAVQIARVNTEEPFQAVEGPRLTYSRVDRPGGGSPPLPRGMSNTAWLEDLAMHREVHVVEGETAASNIRAVGGNGLPTPPEPPPPPPPRRKKRFKTGRPFLLDVRPEEPKAVELDPETEALFRKIHNELFGSGSGSGRGSGSGSGTGPGRLGPPPPRPPKPMDPWSGNPMSQEGSGRP